MLLTNNMITQRSIGPLHCWFLSILILVTSAITHGRTSNMSTTSACIEKERRALLELRQGLADESDTLSSWSNKSKNCCDWRGLTCDVQTGHVVGLNLSSNLDDPEKPLAGTINTSSLLELKHLTHLDLSGNNFEASEIPRKLGNLSNLQTLDLSWSPFIVHNLDWLSGLSSLKQLDLSGLNLSQVFTWPIAVSKLPSLLGLRLQQSSLPDLNPTTLRLPFNNFSKSLQVLDLSVNSFSSSIYQWIANISTNNLVDIGLSWCELQGQVPDVWGKMGSLKSLDLSGNKLEGGIPNSFRKLCRLESLDLQENRFTDRLEDSVEKLSCANDTLKYLYLSSNPFSGPFPDLKRYSSLMELKIDDAKLSGPLSNNLDQLSNLEIVSLVGNQLSGSLPGFIGLSSLRSLDLRNNQLNGTIAESIGLLSSLETLSLYDNSLSGLVTEIHFSNLSRLRLLNFHGNALTLNLSSDWTPPFQLEELYMSSCKVGPAFPKWLKNQRKLEQLSIAQASIADSLPYWFRNLSSPLTYLNLSSNEIHGKLPDLSSNVYLSGTVDLSSNHFSGPLPSFPPNVTTMILSKNMFSGAASSFCMTHHSKLHELDLSDNKLSGELPDCWTKFKNLIILRLANNNFSGRLPTSLGNLAYVVFLHLRNNNFSGGMSSLQKLKGLGHLDLGGNILSGNLPEWFGKSLASLRVLRLRSNKFYGRIPASLCSLQDLQLLDLSQNNLSGALPHCFSNMTAMAGRELLSTYRYRDFVNLTWKGGEAEFGKNLELMRSIDISSNHLSGEIPEGLTSLLALKSLNLSRNNLTGRIPGNISRLDDLESLDLSLNQLSGEIPSSFSRFHFLSHLNLSYNKLTGKIPSGPQMQTFEASAYIGNAGLFGPPLTTDSSTTNKTVHHPGVPNHTKENGDDDRYVTFGFYVSLVIGFVVGFWGFCGTLLVQSNWRHGYFRFLNRTADWFYVTTRVFKARLLRRFSGGDNN